jgi:hypothetical protein
MEINYYSKYLKYKQKYINKKNLQIGSSYTRDGATFISIYCQALCEINNKEINCTEVKIKKDLRDTLFITLNFFFNNYLIPIKKDTSLFAKREPEADIIIYNKQMYFFNTPEKKDIKNYKISIKNGSIIKELTNPHNQSYNYNITLKELGINDNDTIIFTYIEPVKLVNSVTTKPVRPQLQNPKKF